MINSCVLVGRIARDPEMRYTPAGQAVTNFNLAAKPDALVDGVLSVGGINTFGMVAVVLGILFCLVIGLTMREKMG